MFRQLFVQKATQNWLATSSFSARVATPHWARQLANFQIFLNTNITSRLLGDGLWEALLMIDEPGWGGERRFLPFARHCV